MFVLYVQSKSKISGCRFKYSTDLASATNSSIILPTLSASQKRKSQSSLRDSQNIALISPLITGSSAGHNTEESGESNFPAKQSTPSPPKMEHEEMELPVQPKKSTSRKSTNLHITPPSPLHQDILGEPAEKVGSNHSKSHQSRQSPTKLDREIPKVYHDLIVTYK